MTLNIETLVFNSIAIFTLLWSPFAPPFVPKCSVATLKKSKPLDGPLKKPQKTPGQICKELFLEKIEPFLEKIELFLKKAAFVEKMSDDLFLVINSEFFTFNGPKTEKQQLVPYFLTKKHLLSSKKNTSKYVFFGEI